MPVHDRGGGCYQWGDHGKVYCGKGAREKAARQGAAAHASGYKGAKGVADARKRKKGS